MSVRNPLVHLDGIAAEPLGELRLFISISALLQKWQVGEKRRGPLTPHLADPTRLPSRLNRPCPGS